MKACVIREHGDANVLKVEADFPAPTLSPGSVIVKNEFAGLNFIDTYHRKGLYPRDLPFVAGQEGGGTIVEVSPEAEAAGFAVGQTVAYMAFGSYAEYTAVPASKCVAVPDGLDLDVVIACMVQGLTAHYLASSAHADLIKPGEWMLIYSVGSGTCQWAAQMAKLRGYKVIGTTSKGKLDVAKATGCDELIVLDCAEGRTHADYASIDIEKKVKEITGGAGCKCIIDGVGASTYEISLACLSRRGIFISFGNASGAVPAFPVLKLNAKSAFVTRPKLGDYIDDPKEFAGRCSDVLSWLKEGKLKVGIDRKFALESAVDGHEYLEQGKSKGKVLYTI
jgi:NADPH2:quinone reductase